MFAEINHKLEFTSITTCSVPKHGIWYHLFLVYTFHSVGYTYSLVSCIHNYHVIYNDAVVSTLVS